MTQPNEQTNPSQDLPAIPVNMLDVLNLISRIKKHKTTAPTNSPKNFFDQLEFVDTGVKSLYANVNNEWINLGGAVNVSSSSQFASKADNSDIVGTCGFTPKFILMLAVDLNNPSWSVGFGTGISNRNCILNNGTAMDYYGDRIVNIKNGSDGRAFDIKSLDTNGFTLSVTSSGAGKTVYYFYLAVG
jgi:hypothetical protein